MKQIVFALILVSGLVGCANDSAPPDDGNLFKITLLGGGSKGTDPRPNMRVIRHDLATGAVLGDKLSDINGVADFGDIGATRATFSVIETNIDSNGTTTGKDITTFVFNGILDTLSIRPLGYAEK